MRIVLDTNVLISAFATRGLCSDLFRDVISFHTLCISDYILTELVEKLVGKFRIPSSTVEDIQTLLTPHLITVEVLPELEVTIRDKDDIPIVAFAIAVDADWLITGDRDILDVSAFLPIRVISPRQFYEK